jgi:hypothetical protein
LIDPAFRRCAELSPHEPLLLSRHLRERDGWYECSFEALYAQTDPALLSFLLDAGHAYRGGPNVPAFLRAHSKRLVAVPPERVAAVGVAPSSPKETVPVGVPEPVVGATVAVRVTFAPTPGPEGVTVSVVVVSVRAKADKPTTEEISDDPSFRVMASTPTYC